MTPPVFHRSLRPMTDDERLGKIICEVAMLAAIAATEGALRDAITPDGTKLVAEGLNRLAELLDDPAADFPSTLAVQMKGCAALVSAHIQKTQ